MKSGRAINESNLSEVSGGVSSRGVGVVSIGECCGEWKCNICGSSIKYNSSNIYGAPLCSHYIYLSCRSCIHYDDSNHACRKKV